MVKRTDFDFVVLGNLLYPLCSTPSLMTDTFGLRIKNKDCRDGIILSDLSQ